jgi:hypothetical protein
MNEFLKYLKGMKKERATPTRKKTGRAEGPLKELNLKNRSRRAEGFINPPPIEDAMNPRYEERRLNEAIATLDEKSKEKISQVNSLLNRSSPVTEHIMAIQLPEKFKILTIQTYTGVEDPTEHLDNYKMHMDLQGTSQELAC